MANTTSKPLSVLVQDQLSEPMRKKVAELSQWETMVDNLWHVARQTWIQVPLSQLYFARYLANRINSERILLEAIEMLPAGDLFLAAGCTKQIPEALEQFEIHVMRQLPVALAHTGAIQADIDDALQQLRERLLVNHPNQSAKIAEYSGRGKLYSWVRVAAIRTLHNNRRKNHRELQVPSDALWERLLPPGDEELERVKIAYREQFSLALGLAVSSLDTRQRLLLKQHFIDGLRSEELGALYKVHRATSSRWILSAQEALVKSVRKHLVSNLGIAPEELSSILRLIQSRFEAPIGDLLNSDE